MKKLIFLLLLPICTVSCEHLKNASIETSRDVSAPVKIVKSSVRFKKIIITDENDKKYEYFIKGICYAPDTEGAMYYENYKKDIPLIKETGANSIRTYRPFCAKNDDGTFNIDYTNEILDECLKNGLTVTVGFSYEDMAENGALEEYLKEFGNHPAILIIALGNEYNYHYDEWFSKDDWLARLAYGVRLSKQYAPNKIVATVHGEIPSRQEFREYINTEVDLILVNIYRGSTFGFAKKEWYGLTDSMPWVLGEFGRSSKDGDGNDTSKLQASTLRSLIKAMESGYLFSLADDAAKGQYQVSPNIGREDSLGIFDEERNPKPAVKVVQEGYKKISGMVPYER